MKKNKMMRLASVVLVLVLLTTCAISGTFAKYITDNDASDTARVAKFGVVIQADGVLYDTEYNDVAQSDANAPSTSEDKAVISVNSEDEDKVVAPGTESEKGLAFSLNGNPEVRTQLDAEIVVENIYLKAGEYGVMVEAPNVTANSWAEDTYYTVADGVYTLSDAWAADTVYYTLEKGVNVQENYYPVIYTASDYNSGSVNRDSLEAVALNYIMALGGESGHSKDGFGYKTTYTITGKVYDANFDYASLGVEDETLTWKWAFERERTAYADGADTILGDLMEANDGDQYDLTVGEVVKLQGDGTYKAPIAGTEDDENDYHLTTSFAMEISVTQLD